jgi:uncharacterized membrane protein
MHTVARALYRVLLSIAITVAGFNHAPEPYKDQMHRH